MSPRAGWQSQYARAQNRNRAKTHCPHGHPYDAANTHINKRGARECRACRKSIRRNSDVEVWARTAVAAWSKWKLSPHDMLAEMDMNRAMTSLRDSVSKALSTPTQEEGT